MNLIVYSLIYKAIGTKHLSYCKRYQMKTLGLYINHLTDKAHDQDSKTLSEISILQR